MFRFFAHGGEVHETAVESTSHSLFTEWYFALPVFLVGVYGLVRVVYLLSQSKNITVAATLVMLFAVGIGTYRLSPVVSILALSGGFGLALFQTMVGLSLPPKKHHK